MTVLKIHKFRYQNSKSNQLIILGEAFTKLTKNINFDLQ